MFSVPISLLPEILLAAGIIVMLLVNRFRETKTPKTFFTLSKIFTLLSLLAVVVFYNRSAFPSLFRNFEYTALFKILVYILALASFYLACKWFLSKNYSSLSYYVLTILSLLLLSLSISACNLLSLAVCLHMGFGLNYFLIRVNSNEEVSIAVSRRFMFGWLVMLAVNAAGLSWIYTENGSLAFTDVYDFYRSGGLIGWQALLSALLILVPLFYMLGIAPFHFWFADAVGSSVLPVSAYITIVPAFAYMAVLVNLCSNAFFPLYSGIRQFLIACAVLSVVLGAVGANSETNLRKLFAYTTLYNLGVVLICLSALNDNSLLSSFVYMLVYLMAMFGVYTVFYAFKSKGEYLTQLSDIAGISEVRPYISAAFLVFMVSLLGTPPMLGFLGKLSAVNNLVIQNRYSLIVLIMTALVMVAYAYLLIIKTIYFDPRKNTFDRADKGVYICLMINLVLVLISILNPKYLMHDAETILSMIL